MAERADVDRLRLEMETLWGPDRYGRPTQPRPLVAVAVALDGRAVRFGTDAPGEPVLGSGEGAPAIEADRERLASQGIDARVSGYRSFVVDSRGIARRLGLRPIGWIWQLRPEG